MTIYSTRDRPIQHITASTIENISNKIISACFKELLIKYHVIEQHIDLFSYLRREKKALQSYNGNTKVVTRRDTWRDEWHKGDFIFITDHEYEDKLSDIKKDKTYNGIRKYCRFGKMVLHNDGTFDITSICPEDTAWEEYFNLFYQEKYYNKERERKFVRSKLIYIMTDSDGVTNTIYDTDYFPVGDPEHINQTLIEIGENSRSRCYLDELFMSFTDITYFKHDNRSFYYTGGISTGMRSNLQRGSVIREITSDSGEIIFDKFPDLLHIFSTVFVNNATKISSILFPFKYIREWFNLHQGAV